MLTAAPSVQMQDIPSDLLSLENTEEPDPDVRNSTDDLDKRLMHSYIVLLSLSF